MVMTTIGGVLVEVDAVVAPQITTEQVQDALSTLVVNNLVSTSTAVPLSAAMGKELAGMLAADGALTGTEAAITGATVLDSAAFGRWHAVSGTTQYTITLPNPSGNAGKFVGFRCTAATNFIKLAPYGAETVGGLVHDCLHSGKVIIYRCDGTGWQAVHKYDTLTVGMRLDVTTAMGVADFNAWLACLPRVATGIAEVNVYFAAGTYVWGSYVNIANIKYRLNLHGDTSISSASTAQNVIINFSGTSGHGLVFNTCSNIYVHGFKILVNGGSYYNSAIQFLNCPSFDVSYCYLVGTAISGGIGVMAQSQCIGVCSGNNFTNLIIAIASRLASNIYSQNNYSVATIPAYGLQAYYSSKIGKFTTDQPTGSSANEDAQCGSQII